MKIERVTRPTSEYRNSKYRRKVDHSIIQPVQSYHVTMHLECGHTERRTLRDPKKAPKRPYCYKCWWKEKHGYEFMSRGG